MENKNKTQKLPPEVYYLVLNGAKQYFKNKEDAEEMARKLYEDGTSPGGIYTENDPDEIQDLYDVGYFHDDDKPDYEVVNDKSIDAIKDNFTPPGAKDENKSDLLKAAEKVIKTSKPVEVNEYLTLEPRESKAKVEVDELADFQKSLDDYAAKNKKGRDDIPTVTTRR